MEKLYKILKVLILILALAVLVVGSYVLYDRLSGQVEIPSLTAAPETGEASKTAAPDFTVYDEEGNAYRLSDFQGQPVILNFWASWCGPCTSEMPDIEHAYQEYGDQIQFLLVNLTDGYQETVDSAQGYIQEQGYTFPVYYDTDLEAANAYTVSAIPATYFIDGEGNIASTYRGAMSAEVLQQRIDQLLGN